MGRGQREDKNQYKRDKHSTSNEVHQLLESNRAAASSSHATSITATENTGQTDNPGLLPRLFEGVSRKSGLEMTIQFTCFAVVR